MRGLQTKERRQPAKYYVDRKALKSRFTLGHLRKKLEESVQHLRTHEGEKMSQETG